MYRIVKFNGHLVQIHSNEFCPNTMKIVFIGNYKECKKYLHHSK